MFLIAQVDQICSGTGGPNGPGKPGGPGGPVAEWTLDYIAQHPGGPYSMNGPGKHSNLVDIIPLHRPGCEDTGESGTYCKLGVHRAVL